MMLRLYWSEGGQRQFVEFKTQVAASLTQESENPVAGCTAEAGALACATGHPWLWM